MSWSEQQWEAITARGHSLLVSAAAGSGKTSVLVERVIERIKQQRPGPQHPEGEGLDRLLVITFTKAAAAEMRERIGNALAAERDKGYYTAWFDRQLLLLNSADISTMHSFYQSVVRKYFYMLDLDPNFRIAAAPELALIKTDVLEQLFQEYYEQGQDDFLKLAEQYGDEHGDVALQDMILDLYEFSRSHPFPEHWLEQVKQSFDIPPQATLDSEPCVRWSVVIMERMRMELAAMEKLSAQLVDEARQDSDFASYAAVFQADLDMVQMLNACQSWQQLFDAMQQAGHAEDFRKHRCAKEADPQRKSWYQDMHNKKIKDRLKAFQSEWFSCSPAQLLNDLRTVAPTMNTVIGLVLEFARRYQQVKKQKTIVDFDDLVHGCLHILLAPDSTPDQCRPSVVALQLRDRYSEIMVDEYQDTNEVQDTIIQLLAHPNGDNLFMVGDVKQSIYRFRLAEPRLFLAKYQQYADSACRSGKRVDLAHNYRSRPEILHAVNCVFAQIMSPRFADGLSYGQAEALHPGRKCPEDAGDVLAGPTELHIIEMTKPVRGAELPIAGLQEADADEANGEELQNFEAQSAWIADKISDLMSTRVQIVDKNSQSYRPLRYRDIVILLRATEGRSSVLLDTLRRYGIPCYAELKNGYFAEVEVQVMLSLLTIVDNPQQDIALAAVLRSPLVKMNEQELTAMRLACPQGNLWTAVTACAAANHSDVGYKAQDFIDKLGGWRDLSRRTSVAELIWQLYRDTGYYEYAGCMPGGTLRQANLRALYDRARQYEQTNYRGLFRFLRFLEKLRNRGSDLSVARALSDSEDVVRIMTIHASKGLEFPVVFIANLNGKFNQQDTRKLLLAHKQLGVGPFVMLTDLNYRYPSLARLAIKEQLLLETKAEEMRILYVAMTRAREKLFLVGAVADASKTCEHWCSVLDHPDLALPDLWLLHSNCFLDWIGPCLVRHPDGQPIRNCSGSQVIGGRMILCDDPAQWKVEIHSCRHLGQTTRNIQTADPLLEAVQNLMPVPSVVGPDWVERRLEWEYPYAELIGKPAKVAVSDLNRKIEQSLDPDSAQMNEAPFIAARPRFVQQAHRLTATEYGTFMHLVLQHIDFRADVSQEGIGEQLAAMVRREVLLDEQARQLDVQALSCCLSGPLGQRLRASNCVRRELPFSLMLPAARLYPEIRSQEAVFVQGVIDCLFNEGDGLVLVDYKTDYVDDVNEIAERYHGQLTIYAQAAEAILHQPVHEKLLYLLKTGEMIRIL